MDEATFTEQIAPFLPLLGTIAGGLLIGGFAIWNRRRGAVETRAPDVNEIWQREERLGRALDGERTHRRVVEDFAEMVLDTFRGYARRVRRGGSPELTEKEQSVHDAAIPSVRIPGE